MRCVASRRRGEVYYVTPRDSAPYSERRGGSMGKLEIVALFAAAAGFVGVQSLEGPVEDRLIDTAGALMAMTQPEFETWCERHGAQPNVEFDATRKGTVTCAWIDRDTQRAWHAALHFDGIDPTPIKADAGLVDASESTVLRLVSNEFGMQDMKTGEGFPA